ncbi:MAG: hypothetical protein ACM3ST_13715 [Bdellovibrio bacteriovorus]
MTNKRRPRGLLAHIDQAMQGLTHAHLGDYLPDQDKRAALGVAEPVRLSIVLPAGETLRAPRRVALAVQGQVKAGALRYARSACERMDADLDVLTDLSEGQLQAAIEPQAQPLAAGHRLEIVRLGRDLLTGILDYARGRRGLLFVVVSADDAVAERLIAGSSDRRHLEVPWVVVTGAETG